MQCLSSFLGLPGLNMFPNVQIVVVGNNFYLVCCHCSCLFKKQSRAPATQWQVVKDFGTVSRAQPSTVLLVPQTADLPCLPFQYLGWVFCLACGEAPSKNNCTPFHGRGSLYQGDSAGQPCTPRQCPQTRCLFSRLRRVWSGTWASRARLVPENSLSLITFPR